MLEFLNRAEIAIIGGGRFCRKFLEFVFSDIFAGRRPRVRLVVDSNDRAEGMRYARERGIPTAVDPGDIGRLRDLDALIELTGNPLLGDTFKASLPATTRLVDFIGIQLESGV